MGSRVSGWRAPHRDLGGGGDRPGVFLQAMQLCSAWSRHNLGLGQQLGDRALRL
ncbi:MAG: hypothetical protein KME14_14480 [Tildeniella torsiva UHER 1998/13D]|nr:hypothetical protein [Tildeniella torsiva UHER 1998/13D]